jgi:heme exporter protein C
VDLRGGVEELKKALYALVVAVVTVWSFFVPDGADFPRPELARIFFWHFPCPMMLTALLFAGVLFSLRHLIAQGPDEKREWDLRAVAALELGLVFGCLTMLSGIVFSYAQWGAAWQWDPRQSSFLIALLIYAAYFALRAGHSDPDKRAANAAAYMMAAVFPLLFLIFVFPRLPQVVRVSFHPNDTVMGGKLHGQYLYVTLALMALVSVLTVWLYRLRVAAGLLLIKNSDGYLETSGRRAGPSVVARPVSVPAEGGADR